MIDQKGQKKENIVMHCMPFLVIRLSLGSVHTIFMNYTLELWLDIFSGSQEESEGTKMSHHNVQIWADISSLRGSTCIELAQRSYSSIFHSLAQERFLKNHQKLEINIVSLGKGNPVAKYP